MLSYSAEYTGNHPAKRFSRIADLLPVLLLLLAGIVNGMFYKAVIISETARLIIIFNFSFSTLIILYCTRRGFLFSRILPEAAKKKEVERFFFLSSEDTVMSKEVIVDENNNDAGSTAIVNPKRGMERKEPLKGEDNFFIRDQHQFFKEAAEYANTFLN